MRYYSDNMRRALLILMSVVPLLPLAASSCSSDVTDTAGPGAGGELGSGGSGGSTTTSSSSSSSSSSTTSSTSGSGGSAGAGASGGAGGSVVCNDFGIGEPNDSEATAFKLKADTLSECEGDHIVGWIAGDNDPDWFYYKGDDNLCTIWAVKPARDLDTSDSDLRVCAYFECVSAEIEIQGGCPSGTTDDTSPAGRVGCCGDTDGFQVEINCKSTTDDDAWVYIRVDKPTAVPSTCSEYTLNYEY